ncbi:succinate dehydrogenase/fumarate reductase flavoprotein subunit [Pseudochelatococcus lubricantis]|uniref:Succinate dehydrogenase/fumarate reductase flavoprotein subunit n=1 Tax=Pseudochelatococcus lubricantis TaxID=1538102 RepID=A0ABX0V515_9HYPH|nr:FAD-binding protein [Pseudochelatococcus lubricantis]NIJ59169.1 succinate dehydrogenase/fumarate reductase flavoprotein subunit [Pseudochelatococcus lubricantis]
MNSDISDGLALETDVLVIGGGPAATWAALTAREEGARVVLADKGYCGSSGVAAPSTIGHWWVAEENRPAAMAEKARAGGYLSDPAWMARILDETWRTWPRIADRRGYRQGDDGDAGAQPLVQGPVYLREMRRLIKQAGVTILDHSPALELLAADGAVCGARGLRRHAAGPWRVHAGAVILATGGCAFKSGCLGGNVATGDGYLMAAEAGARLTGMEFSNYYGLVPVGCSIDKNGYYLLATYYDERGREIDRGWSPPAGVVGTAIARAFIEGPVFARFDRVAPQDRLAVRASQPNLLIQFDRLGIDPFTEKFRIEPIMEGSVRGTGGVVVADETCWTGVPGLWVAGDTASRQHITGAASGAGSANAAWTVSSGRWSGKAAARHARERGRPRGHPAPAAPEGRNGAAARPTTEAGALQRLEKLIGAEVHPLEKNGLRSATGMTEALGRLENGWDLLRNGLAADDVRARIRLRETEAMLATARWSYIAALAREETRGMHVRADFPATEQGQHRQLILSGIDAPVLEAVPVARNDFGQ